MIRIGIGYDIHPLVSGRPLILGGVFIPFDKGLGGHSDGDVLCHAIADGILGAASMGDIGEHFPDTDPDYKDASSLMLLGVVNQKIVEAGFRIVNIDATVIAETPKLTPFKGKMKDSISRTLQINEQQVSVKATTNESFDALGHGEAIAVYASTCLEITK